MNNMYEQQIPYIEPIKSHFKKVDTNLLIELMLFQTPTGNHRQQKRFLIWVLKWCKNNNIDVKHELDSYGNLYLTKGTSHIYPCVVSHVDVVHEYNRYLDVHKVGNLIVGINKKTGTQCGIGADPKNGVYFALEMLRKLNCVKVVLTKDEEIGMVGASQINVDFFKDCSFLIQLDRRSFTNDVIEYTNGIQVLSEEIKKAMEPILKKYNLSFNRGTATDIGEIVKQGIGLSACNWSNGSINEHMNNECCSLPHLLNGINSAYECILMLGYEKAWKHVPEIRSFNFEKELYYHSTPNWKFTKEDEEYVQNFLAINQCPYCCDTNLVRYLEDTIYCKSCGSSYNIPGYIDEQEFKTSTDEDFCN